VDVWLFGCKQKRSWSDWISMAQMHAFRMWIQKIRIQATGQRFTFTRPCEKLREESQSHDHAIV
jgi:hypothetical protein